MRKLARRLVAVVLLAAMLAAVGWLLMPEPVAVDVAQPTRGVLEVFTADEGETRARERYVVAAPVAGRLMRIGLREGDPVKARDPVAELAPLPLSAREREELLARVAAARAAMREAEERARRAAQDSRRPSASGCGWSGWCGSASYRRRPPSRPSAPASPPATSKRRPGPAPRRRVRKRARSRPA